VFLDLITIVGIIIRFKVQKSLMNIIIIYHKLLGINNMSFSQNRLPKYNVLIILFLAYAK